MTIQLLFNNITCVSFFLLALIAFFNPSKLNLVANKWFALFLFSAGCMLLNSIIYRAGAESTYTQLIAFNELSRFLIAPALYLSVVHFTSPDKVLQPREYFHFIPFVLFFIYISPVVVAPAYQGVSFFQLPEVIHRHMPALMQWAIRLQLLAYWVMAWMQLNKHQKNIREIHSAVTDIDLKWLRYLLLGIIFLLVTWMASAGTPSLEAFTPALYLGGVLCIGYYLLAQKEIYLFETAELVEIGQVIAHNLPKAPKQRFADERAMRLKEKLQTLMVSEKIYLDSELSLPQLAKMMDVSTHDLSYLLNDSFGVNFFNFVNRYRVDEAKQLMLSGQNKHLNLLGIAYSAGFNSKTTFNMAFKKQAGLSPSEFMKQGAIEPLMGLQN